MNVPEWMERRTPWRMLWRGAMLSLILAVSASGQDLTGSSRFPKDDPAGFLREFKIADGMDAPLRRVVEDWDGARARARDDSGWASWLAERRREVESWMAERRDHPEWIAGWWHDFVSPKDGSFLEWTPDEPGPRTLSSKSDPSVELTPKLHAAWVYLFRTRHAEMMVEAARLFRLTGDERFARWVSAQLDFYAENFERWPPRERPGARMMFQSLDEATILTKHIHAVRLLGDFAGPEHRRRWYEGLFGPQCALLQQTMRTIHNIACWHRAAVAQVALCYGLDELWTQAIDGPYGVREQLREGVTSDYLWYEQSLGYNAYTSRALLPLFETAWLLGRAEELRPEMLIVQNLVLSPLVLRFPDGHLPTPADASRGRAPDLAWLAQTARFFPTSLGLREASRRQSWELLLDPLPIPSVDQASELPMVTSRNLESSRMALLVKGDWQVFLHYGQLTGSHAQAEALNFEATYRDLDVTHDIGTVGYGSPLHRGYYTRGPAHNVPLLGGEGQARWDPGALLRFDAENGVVSAEQPRYQPDVRARRTLRIEEDRLIDDVEIQPVSEQGGSARAGLAFHIQGHAQLSEDFRPDPDFATERAPAFSVWRDARTGSFVDVVELDLDFEGHPFRLIVRTAGPFRLTHAVTPDAPPRHRESFYLEVESSRARIEMILDPGDISNEAVSAK